MKCLGTSRHSFGNVNVSQIKLELEVLVFEESKKLEYLEKNLLKQRQKQTTNSTLMSSMPRLEPGHTLMGGNCAPLTSWLPNLNINTLIPYTVHYHFFLILVVLFSLFLLTLMTCMFDQARIILTRRNEIPMTFVTVHYTFSLTAWLSPDLPFGGMGTNGTHRSHVKYLTIPTHSYNCDKQTLWVRPLPESFASLVVLSYPTRVRSIISVELLQMWDDGSSPFYLGI